MAHWEARERFMGVRAGVFFFVFFFYFFFWGGRRGWGDFVCDLE